MAATMNDDRITATVTEFCRLSGLGRTTIHEMLKDGRLESVRVGKRLLIDLDSYRRFVAKQRVEGVPENHSCDEARRVRKEKLARPGRGRPQGAGVVVTMSSVEPVQCTT